MIQNFKKLNTMMFIVLLLSGMFTNALELSKTLKKSTANSNAKVQSKSAGMSSQQMSKTDQALFAGNMVKACIKGVVDSMAPEFCWKKGGDAGVIPKGCPDGYFRNLALCYERCRQPYQFNGAGLCVDGWSSYVPSSITNFSDRATCGDGYYKSGALCYRDCTNVGMYNCGIGACSASKVDCAGTIISMAIDSVMGAGQFVAFALSFGASSTVTPEITAGKNAVQTLTREATQAAFNRIKTSMKDFFKQTVQRAKKAFIENIKELPAGMTAEWVAENYCQGVYNGIRDQVNGKTQPSTVEPLDVLKKFDVFGISSIVDNCGDTNKKAECAKAVVSTASTIDPTGLLTIAAAFIHPSCDIIMPGENRPDPKSFWNRYKSVCLNCDLRRSIQDYGNGHVIFFDRHNIECNSGSVLNSVLFKKEGNSLIVDYRCIKSPSVTNTCQNEYTQWDDFTAGDGSIHYLVRQNLECSNNDYVLQQFILQTNLNTQKMRWAFRCCRINNLNGVFNYQTFPSNVNNDWRTDNIGSADAIDGGSYGGLKGFKLNFTINPNRISFNYKVTTFNGTGSNVVNRQTGWNDAGEGSIWFLDRHYVSCPWSNSAIKAFAYERNGNSIRYNYDCVINPKISNTCEMRFTKLSDIDGNEKKSINFLDRQIVTCMGDESMRSFKLERVDNRLNYKMECCKTESVSSYKNRWDKTDMGDYQSFYLDRQKVVLGVDESLRGFWVENSYNPNVMWYAWEANILN